MHFFLDNHLLQSRKHFLKKYQLFEEPFVACCDGWDTRIDCELLFLSDKFSSPESIIHETTGSSLENAKSLEVKFAGVSSYRTTPLRWLHFAFNEPILSLTLC